MITKFTILGERCSGTNFLERAISKNFNLDVTWDYGWKHFFGIESYDNSDDTLFIGIVREPVAWMNSLYKNPHHLQDDLRKNTENFLNKQFWSYFDGSNHTNYGNEIMGDRNIYTGKRYKNIFEMRKTKLNFLINDMLNKVKHYILIKYEDLLEKYEPTLINIKTNFNLDFTTAKIVHIDTYKGRGRKKFVKKQYTAIDKNVIHKHPDFYKPHEMHFKYI